VSPHLHRLQIGFPYDNLTASRQPLIYSPKEFAVRQCGASRECLPNGRFEPAWAHLASLCRWLQWRAKQKSFLPEYVAPLMLASSIASEMTDSEFHVAVDFTRRLSCCPVNNCHPNGNIQLFSWMLATAMIYKPSTEATMSAV
jgi:hypothetical protein